MWLVLLCLNLVLQFPSHGYNYLTLLGLFFTSCIAISDLSTIVPDLVRTKLGVIVCMGVILLKTIIAPLEKLHEQMFAEIGH